MWNAYWTGRGEPWQHDPGPPAGSRWASLFASTPDYRALGRQRLGREAFRWHFGPMFYRGRLADHEVKVLVIGQEGAQDESLANRSFVGGTGSRLQHFLRALGVTRSYLFLNTFVYPIFGQYGADLRRLGQDPASPIVQHRHALLEEAARTNPGLALVISVGTAAKESVATWKRMRGGSLPAGVRDVHVVHPGAAARGGAAGAIRASFALAFKKVCGWADADPAWLPADPGAARTAPADYRFGDAPIPFADLPLGLAWRVGRGGTSSNRRDGQTAIQLFSEGGAYNNQGDPVTYAGDARGTREGYAEDPGDLAWEPPRDRHDDFDRGPSPALARLLLGGEPGLDWPDFSALGLPAHPSLGFGPIHRGRLEAASVVVLCDQESQDDLFTGRAATGDAGQRLQRFLEASGFTRRYAVLRPLPVNTAGAPAAKVRAAVEHPAVRALHAAILARAAGARALVAVGPQAKALAAAIPHGIPATLELPLPASPGWLAAWRAAFDRLKALPLARDRAPDAEYGGERGQIPRVDLPYGAPRWRGTSGDRALQARVGGKPSPHYFKLVLPGWAAEL